VVVVVADGDHRARTGMPATQRQQQLKVQRLVAKLPRKVRASPGQLLTGISRGTATTLIRRKTARTRPVPRSKLLPTLQRTPGQRHHLHNRPPMVTRPSPSPPQCRRQRMVTRLRLQRVLHPSRKRLPRNSVLLQSMLLADFCQQPG
jgi:hypothetical protein